MIPAPIPNPLTGNLIVCRCNSGGDFLIEEIDASHHHIPTVMLSACISIDELKNKLMRSTTISNDFKVVGVFSVLSLAAGVHRIQGRARVRVAALAEVLVVVNNAMERIRVVAVWKWGYNPGGKELASLQSVLTTYSIDAYDPNTLQVADGLLFLGGHITPNGKDAAEPAVFIAKPAVRNVWASVPLGEAQSSNPSSEPAIVKSKTVSVLAVTNDINTYLAVGLTDGSVSVWSYGLAVRTNRISGVDVKVGNKTITPQTPSLLQPLCKILGEYDVADLEDQDCLWPNERFVSTAYRGTTSKPPQDPVYPNSSDKGTDCLSLSWIQHCSSGVWD